MFARRPLPGRVKTRLSPALPSPLACRVYDGMLADSMESIVATHVDRRILYWADEEPRTTTGAGRISIPAAFQERNQKGGDLGERMAGAFAEMLEHDGDQAVIAGSDCPSLDARRLSEAFEALESRPLVLGPSADGGYYLIGMSRRAPALFEGIPWSTDQVLDRTLSRAAELGLDSHRLEMLEEVDTPADLVRWIARAAVEYVTAGARTCAVLREIGLLPRG